MINRGAYKHSAGKNNTIVAVEAQPYCRTYIFTFIEAVGLDHMAAKPYCRTLINMNINEI